MRGGALAPFCWALVLALFGAINWIWTGDAIQVGTFGFAVAAILALAAGLVLRARDAHRPGPPELDPTPRPEPSASAGALIAAAGFALMIFGLAFGEFPILAGAAVLVIGLVRLAGERHAQRRSP